MKNWFNNLEDKHKLFLIIGLYVGTFFFALVRQYADFFSLLCVACLIFAIIFTVFNVKYKKSNTSQETHTENITAPKSYYLRWERRAKIPYAKNLDKIKWNDTDIQLVPEPDNQYDPNAVALYKGEYKLGYLHKGDTQEMVLKYLKRKDYLIKTSVSWLNHKNSTYKLAVKIAFYHKSDSIK